jgi:hypothetical protein
MNHFKKCVIGLSLVLGTGFTFSTESNQNLLLNLNPGFEKDLESWAYEADYGEFGMSEIFFDDPAAVHSGKKGAKLHVTEAGYINWHVKLSIPSQWEAVKNQKYLLTFWAKSQNPSKKLPLKCSTGLPDFTEIDKKTFTLGDDWKKLEFEFTSLEDGAGAVRLTFCLGLDTGIFYFDDFVLKAVGKVISIRWSHIPSQNLTALETNNGSFKIWDIKGREVSGTLWNKKQKCLPFFVFQKGQKRLPIIDSQQ